MSKKQIFAIVAAAIIVIAAVGTIWALDRMGGQAEGDVKVVDMRGRTVYVDEDVEKVVCLSASSLRLVSYFGAVDMVVGIDSFDANALGSPANYYKATYRIAYMNISSITSVGSEANFAAINDTGADVIFTSVEASASSITCRTRQHPVVWGSTRKVRSSSTTDEFSRQIDLIVKVLGRRKRQRSSSRHHSCSTSSKDTRRRSPVRCEDALRGKAVLFHAGWAVQTTGKYIPFDSPAPTTSCRREQRNPTTLP
jgi:ABC-type Fe3+-hydroxamate transport system substrate-binding protein